VDHVVDLYGSDRLKIGKQVFTIILKLKHFFGRPLLGRLF
jgi:hypothetical protein